MKNNSIDEMRQKIFDMIDPNVEYTYEDFKKEYSNTNTASIPSDYKLNIKFVNQSKNQDPEYATSGSSGFDLRANLDTPYTLEKGAIGIIPTGLYFELPEGLEIQVRPRSGLAAKNGVTVLNTPGTVDSDYRGEIKVILINHGQEPFVINNGDRIAQGVIASVMAQRVLTLKKIDKISNETQRSSGGFGSTGIK